MKFQLLIVFSLVIWPYTLHAQYEQAIDPEVTLKKKFWNSNDPDFKITNCEERWKNESAVILCRSYEYQVKKEILFNLLNENIYTHNRILLLDKAALDNFSTFSFNITKRSGLVYGWNNYNNVYLGLKVIKPNGSEKEIKIDKELVDEYKQGLSKTSIQKVAVPDLEVGDIIDFYTAIEKSIPVNTFFTFSPVLYPLVDEYPVQKQKVELHIMRKCYMSARSMNGAPELNLQDDSKRSDMVYTLTDNNRDKIKDQLFTYHLRELPVLAFQTSFVNNYMAKNRYCFYDKEDVIKKSVTDEELKEFVTHVLIEKNFTSDKIIRYLNKNYKNVTDKNFLIREAYYYFRQITYGKSFDNRLIGYGTTPRLPDDFEFVSTMSAVLKHLKVNHSVEIAVPREIGVLDDLIMINQMGLFLKINGSDALKYLFNFDAYKLISEYNTSYQGVETKEISVPSDLSYMYVRKDSVPFIPADKNMDRALLNVVFSTDEADTLNIHAEITSSGGFKSSWQELAISAKDYMDFCRNNPYVPNDEEKASVNKINKLNQIYQSGFNERETNLKEYFEQFLGVNELRLLNFKLNQPGIWETQPEFKCEFDLKLNQFITKAGDNIIVNIGQLVGVQVRPEKSDSVRQYNVYMPFARTIENVITLNIPQGYAIRKTENLSYNVVNSTGGFVSEAKQEGDKLIVSTKKVFNSNYYTSEMWPDLLQFIDAANNFYNQKIMLTKTE